jgi:hypothetical protein
MSQYNAYQWDPNKGGTNEENYLRNVYSNAGRFANQLTDTTSSFYQQFRSYMGMLTPTEGAGQALGQEVAAGGNYAAGGVVANERAKAFEARRNDFLNKTVAGFAASNVQQATNLLGLQGDIATSAYATKTQKEANERQGSLWQMIAGVLGTVGGALTGGLLPAVVGGMFSGGGGNKAQPANSGGTSSYQYNSGNSGGGSSYQYNQGNYGQDKYGRY